MWKLKGRKSVYDFDGFITDYSWWQDTDTKNNVMIFGDSELYDPENSEPDYETEDEGEAYEWFNTYDIDPDPEDLEDLEESVPNIVLEASGEPKVINLRRYGFVPVPSEDFSDDGNRFKVYYYDPKHTGDRRIRLTKLTADGEAYISAGYRNPDTDKYTFFDDLNGVSYTAAVQGLDALVKKIADFVAKLDAGEMKAKDLTDDQIKEIKEKVSQMVALGDLKWNDALNKVTQKMGIDLEDVRTAQRDQLKKEIESAVRNSRKEDPVIVKALAKEFLKVTLKNLEGTSPSYVGKSWKRG